MFSGIKFSTFLNTFDEWHALVLGFCETAWPIPPLYRVISEEVKVLLGNERWYYVFGRVLGGVSLVFFALGIYHLL